MAPILLTLLALNPDEGREAAAAAVFEDSCALCHDASDDSLNLEAPPADLIGKMASNGKPFVVPGDPDASYIVAKMVGADGIDGDPMPLDDDPVSDEAMAAVRTWIAGLEAEAAGTTAETGASGESSAGEAGEGEGGEPGEGGEQGEQGSQVPAGTINRRTRAPFFGTHQTNLQTTTTLGKKTIAMRIHHRFGRVGKPGDRQYLGLAGATTMSLGAEYGIVDGLDVLARWSNQALDWELGAKYVPIRQEDGKKFSLGTFASFEASTVAPESADNRFTGNVQAMASRLWFERWSTQLTTNLSFLTNHQPGPVALAVDPGDPVDEDGDGFIFVEADNRPSFDLALASSFWLGKKRKNSIDLELWVPIKGQNGEIDALFVTGGDAQGDAGMIPGYALGWSGKVGLHIFQVFVTNMSAIHTNYVAPGGNFRNPFNPFGDFLLGFNITRKWKL